MYYRSRYLLLTVCYHERGEVCDLHCNQPTGGNRDILVSLLSSIFTVSVPGQRPGLDLCSRSRSSRLLLISLHFVTSSSSFCLLSRPVSSQCRYREDRLFHRQQHRLPAAQRDGAGGHPGDGVSASTRQVGHSSPLCESRTWSGV